MGGMAKRGRLIAVMAVSIAILLLASGLPVAAYGPQNSGQNNPSVINGTTVIATIPVGHQPVGVAYDPSNGYIYVANHGSGTVSVISTSVSTSTSISSVTTPTTSTSTKPTPSVVPTWAVAAVVVVVVLMVALLMIKRRKP